MPRRYTKDPTRTITQRRAFEREVSVLMDTLKRFVARLVPLVLTDNVSFISNQAFNPRDFTFKTSQQRREEFDRYLVQEINNLFYDPETGRALLIDRVIRNGFYKSVEITDLEVKAATGFSGLALPVTSAAEVFSVNPFLSGVSQLLYERAFTQLEGITESIAKQLSSNLASSILRGDGVDRTVRVLSEKIDINKRRIQRIVRTESINAYNTGSIEEGKRLAREIGYENPKFRWLTALDGRERPSHNARHNNLYTEEEVRLLIGEPNCRCAVSLHIPEDLFSNNQ